MHKREETNGCSGSAFDASSRWSSLPSAMWSSLVLVLFFVLLDALSLDFELTLSLSMLFLLLCAMIYASSLSSSSALLFAGE